MIGFGFMVKNIIHLLYRVYFCQHLIMIVFEKALFCDILKLISMCRVVKMTNFFGFRNLSENEAKLVNPQVLAFVGDGVYTMYVRNMVALSSKAKSGELHKATASFVKATQQSHIIDRILPMLNKAEQDIFRRGRNYKTHSVAKNASVVDYRRATGFEAVIGYLYLTGNMEKLNLILEVCVKEDNNEN